MNKVRRHRLESLAELGEGDLAVSVEVEAPNDGYKLSLKRLVTHPL